MTDGTGRATPSLATGLALVVVLSSTVAGAALLATPASSLHGANNSDNWPTDRGDAARTGATAGDGPAGPYATRSWSHPIDSNGSTGAVTGRPQGAVVANGTVFVSVEDWDEPRYEQTGSVYAFDTVTGAERWNRSDLAAVEEPPAVHDGTVFVAATLTLPEDELGPEPDSGKGGLFALDAATGETVWKTDQTPDWEGGGSPTVANGTVYAATGSSVYAFDAATGEERWRWENPGPSWPAGGFAVTNETVYVTHGNVSAIDVSTGETQWTSNIPSAEGSLSSPAIADGAIYVSSGPVEYNYRADYGDDVQSQVHRLSTNGSVEWTARLENSLNPSVPDRVSAPAVDDGEVFVTTDDDYTRDSPEGQNVGTVHRLDAATGAEEWRFETVADVRTAPAVTDSNVFVAGRGRTNESGTSSSEENAVLALNRSDGAERWNYVLTGWLYDDHWETVAPANDRLVLVANEPAGALDFSGFVAVLDSSETAPSPYRQLTDDEPRERNHAPLVSIETDPPDAGERDLDGGQNVTLTANASDVDGKVAAIEWDVDDDGEYERTGETITMQIDPCSELAVTARMTDDDGGTTTESLTLSTG